MFVVLKSSLLPQREGIKICRSLGTDIVGICVTDIVGIGGPTDIVGIGGPTDIVGIGGPTDIVGTGGPTDIVVIGGPTFGVTECLNFNSTCWWQDYNISRDIYFLRYDSRWD